MIFLFKNRDAPLVFFLKFKYNDFHFTVNFKGSSLFLVIVAINRFKICYGQHNHGLPDIFQFFPLFKEIK